MSYPHPKRNFVPKAVLMKTGMRPVNVAKPKAAYNAVKRNMFNDVKASACWVWMPKNRVVDHVFKNISASVTLKRLDYIDAQGRFKSVMAWMDAHIIKKTPDAPIIEDWVSDDEEQDESKPKSEKKTVIPTVKKKEFVKAKQDDKTVRNTVKYAEMYRLQKPRGNQRNWNFVRSKRFELIMKPYKLGSSEIKYSFASEIITSACLPIF
ncbi:hypothetical protein Tco_1330160 [Tanacetum coccineum]